MLVPSEQIIQAIANLNASGSMDWRIFREWLSGSYMTQTVMLIDADDPHSAALFAGRCRELKELWHYIDNAQKIINAKPQEEPSVTNPEELTPEEASSLFD